MENKKYLEKVVNHLVRGTKIDYVNNLISPPSYTSPLLPQFFLTVSTTFPPALLSNYCKNTFGLTKEEIEYVWNEYKEIIKEKIKR